MKHWKLSASSVAAFKACPTRFKLAYVDGVRLDEDTEGQRIGNAWHAMHEAIRTPEHDGESVPELLQTAWAVLNQRYESVPHHITPDAWEAERMVLAVAISCYLTYWHASDPVTNLYTEIKLDLPLHHPQLGLPLPDVTRVGKIDRLCRQGNRVLIQEYKSTSRSIEPDSDYWDRLKLDTQISKYALDMRDAQEMGHLADVLNPDDEVGIVLYDVFKRPTTKPKALTQGDTAAFIASQHGTYFGQTFTVVASATRSEGEGKEAVKTADVTVDGEPVEVIPGKKGFAIRETVGMYGARLGAEMMESPERYFARRQVVRTDAELREFRQELYNIYRTQRYMDANEAWFKNEAQCKATFHCPFIAICHHGIDPAGPLPPGYKRIFNKDADFTPAEE